MTLGRKLVNVLNTSMFIRKILIAIFFFSVKFACVENSSFFFPFSVRLLPQTNSYNGLYGSEIMGYHLVLIFYLMEKLNTKQKNLVG